MKYRPTIGLEIHVELGTNSKMFCSCRNASDEKHPNVNICPICMGHPGTLPVINEEAVKKVIKTGLALNCHIPERSKFDRKNYFYPDLPKGYQISQYDLPLCKDGYLEIGSGRRIEIRRIHLEEDTGRLIHPEGADYSLVDFNRAGIPLMELVTEPDIASAKEAVAFAGELQLILRYLGVSDANMERGQMRVEANISLTPTEKLGTKVEIKNLNSFRVVEKAIAYEIARQSKLLDRGQKVTQETRGWHDMKQITFSQRSKEEAHDYRYFPEPDLPPLELAPEEAEKLRPQVELPQQKRQRFSSEYKLADKEIEVLVRERTFGNYFERTASELKNWVKEMEGGGSVSEDRFDKLVRLAANYLLSDLRGLLKEKSVESEDFLISPENFAEFIALLYEDKISSKMAKNMLAKMFATGKDPHHIMEEEGLSQLSDEAQIEKITKEIIAQNAKAVQDYRDGKANALQFLIGQVMARTNGRVNPELARKLLMKSI